MCLLTAPRAWYRGSLQPLSHLTALFSTCHDHWWLAVVNVHFTSAWIYNDPLVQFRASPEVFSDYLCLVPFNVELPWKRPGILGHPRSWNHVRHLLFWYLSYFTSLSMLSAQTNKQTQTFIRSILLSMYPQSIYFVFICNPQIPAFQVNHMWKTL